VDALEYVAVAVMPVFFYQTNCRTFSCLCSLIEVWKALHNFNMGGWEVILGKLL